MMNTKPVSFNAVMDRIDRIDWATSGDNRTAKEHAASIFAMGTTFANSHPYVLRLMIRNS